MAMGLKVLYCILTANGLNIPMTIRAYYIPLSYKPHYEIGLTILMTIRLKNIFMIIRATTILMTIVHWAFS